MPKTITLSRNELWALLTRTFEALYGHRRDYYDMARSVLWLECHGFKGVEQLIAALPALEQKDLRPPQLNKISDTRLNVDCGGRSLFCIGRSICDLALSGAADFGHIHVNISNVSDAEALIGLLSYSGFSGFSTLTLCHNTIGVIKAGDSCPDIYKCVNNDIIAIKCADAKADISEFLPAGSELLFGHQIHMKKFNENLEKGVTIDRSHYKAMNHVADRILVEATEESRRGAGE